MIYITKITIGDFMEIVQTWDSLPKNIKAQLEGANIFYQQKYENYIISNGCIQIYLYDEKYIQVAYISCIHRLFNMLVLPSEPYLLKTEDSFEKQQKFLNEVIITIRKEYRVDWLTVTPASSLFSAYPLNSKRIRFGNYVIDLSNSVENIFQNVKSKHRNMIRRGEKSGIEIRFGGKELIKDYIFIDKQTWQRNGKEIDHSEEYLKYIDIFGDTAFIGIAYKDGMPQCGLLGFYNKKMFYYMFGASINKPEPGSTHFLQWNTILKMKQENVHYYNFVGCRINVDPDSKYHNNA